MFDFGEQIERWENVERVLVAMPEHECQNHWDMATWGEKTDCGTVACAAGQCGLDPWFRERGFTLEFRGSDAKISDVGTFFGIEGSSRIFLNSTRRSVETVIEEVRAYLTELRSMASLSTHPSLPRIGEEWPEQEGVFAGAILGRDGAANYYLIVGPEYDGQLSWSGANNWAVALSAVHQCGFVLPDRSEGHVLFDRVRSLFQPHVYWLSEQHASNSNSAWYQHFHNGNQNNWNKDNELRARAVRRLVIQ